MFHDMFQSKFGQTHCVDLRKSHQSPSSTSENTKWIKNPWPPTAGPVAHPHSPHCSLSSLGTFALPRRIPKQSCSPKRLLAQDLEGPFHPSTSECVKQAMKKKSVAYEGLMGFEGKLIISPDSSLKEVRRTYKRGSYDEKWNIILTNPQSTTVISRISSGRQHSSNVFCCPNGKIMAAKLAPAESAWSKHHEWSEEIKVDVLRTVQQCLRYF